MPHGLEKPLDFTEQLILLEYIECRSFKVAAERVGVTERDVLLLYKRKAFQDELARLTQTTLGRAEVTAQRIVDELASIGFDRDTAKDSDRIRALELLGKWAKIKMFTEVVETSTSDEVARVKTMELEERIKLMEKSRDPSLLEPQ